MIHPMDPSLWQQMIEEHYKSCLDGLTKAGQMFQSRLTTVLISLNGLLLVNPLLPLKLKLNPLSIGSLSRSPRPTSTFLNLGSPPIAFLMLELFG